MTPTCHELKSADSKFGNGDMWCVSAPAARQPTAASRRSNADAQANLEPLEKCGSSIPKIAVTECDTQAQEAPIPVLTKQLLRECYRKKKAGEAKDKSKRQRVKERRKNVARDKKRLLDVHGLFSSIGDACNEGKKVASHIETAKKISDALEGLKSFLKYSGSSNEDLIENLICRIEDVAALIAALMNSQNYVGFISVLHMYIRTHYTKSTTKVMINLIKKLFEAPTPTVSQNDSKLTPHSAEVKLSPEEQVEQIKSYVRDWRNMRHGVLARNVGALVTILTTFGWTDLDENPIKLGDFEIFRARAWDVQKNSLDFMELVLDTVSFFLERGYLAFAKGDFSLLFHDDSATAAFEQEYSLLISCDSLMETGRLEDLRTEKINGEADFEQRLENLIAKCFGMLQVEKNPYAKTLLTNRLVVLKKLRSKLIMLQKQSPVRTKPYGVCIFGGSAVGKSMVNAIVTKVLLERNGFESSKMHVVTLNDSDPYQSEFRTYHTAVTMDDFGNTKADKYEGSPTAKIIDFLNNVPKAALSPIAELKGNVMMRPKLVTATTNVKELMAGLFSNEPVSILRRFEVHLDVRLRPEWVDPETGGINVAMIDPDVLIPDAWLIDLQRVKIDRTKDPNMPDDFHFEIIKKDASLMACLQWMIEQSKLFYEQQERFVASTEKFYDLKICEHLIDCTKCSECCKLVNQAKETPFEEDFEDFMPIEDAIDHVPLENVVRQWYLKMGGDTALRYTKSKCKTLQEAFEAHKSECLTALFASAGALALIYGAVKFLRSAKMSVELVSGQSREDGVPEVLPEDHESNWKKVEVAPLPMTARGKTRSRDQFEQMIRRCLAYCTVFDYSKGVKRSCQIFPIRGNTWLLPGHMLPKNTSVVIKVRQGKNDAVNRVFEEEIGEAEIQRFNDDYALVRLVKGGPIPDTTDMIVQEEYPFANEHVRFIVKDSEGMSQVLTTKLIEARKYATKEGNLDGLAYNLPIPTETGMCISPVYTYRSPHQIVGFHLAGISGQPFGVAGRITCAQIEAAMSKLNAKNSLQCHSEGDMFINKYGTEIRMSSDIPADHAVHKLAPDEEGQEPTAIIYGIHSKGRSFFKSEVRKSPISDLVKEHMGIDRIHGPPNRKDIGQHWERDLNLMAHPKGDFTPSVWDQARTDLRNKVTRFVETHPEIARVTYPLAHDYVMSGADGIAAYSRIPLNTSMGWPLNKKKKGFIGPVEREVPGVTDPIDFNDPMFLDEVYRIEECLARGERIHTVFRGNLKDEPTKWTKNKIRVFAGCEVAFTYVVRKYCLPIVRLIQNNWKDFECAVGINAHGPQWEELYQYLTTFGEDRVGAGDFAHFDKSANPKPMMSAFDVFILIANLCGYTEREIRIMWGIATEISYPIYELDGVILQLFGSNPSGHPLTVIINNIMNQLYMRYAYYKLHEEEDPSTIPVFDSVIKLMCYGDDNATNTSPSETKFNMVNVVPTLNSAGIIYTKADKTPVQPGDEFQHITEIDFLKRKFVDNPPFGMHTAALDINSIGKSLHNQMVSKTTPRDVIAAQALQGANLELAFHGPDVFHDMRPKLERVVDDSGLRHLVGDLPTLEDIVNRFNNSRLPRPMVEEPVLDCQSTEEAICVGDREAELQNLVVLLVGQTPLLHEVCLGHSTIGTPDLVFRFPLDRHYVYLAIETKSVVTGNKSNKLAIARRQAKKYSMAFAVLQASSTVIGMIYTEFGFEIVSVYDRHQDFSKVSEWLGNQLLLAVPETAKRELFR